MRYKSAAENSISLCIEVHIDGICRTEDAVSIMLCGGARHETAHAVGGKYCRTQHTNEAAITHGKHLHIIICGQAECGYVVLHGRNYCRKYTFCQG